MSSSDAVSALINGISYKDVDCSSYLRGRNTPRIQRLLLLLLPMVLGVIVYSCWPKDGSMLDIEDSGTRISQAAAYHSRLNKLSHANGLVLQDTELDPNDINPTMPANIRKALVIASYKDQDNGWVKTLRNKSPGWEVFRYLSKEEFVEEDGARLDVNTTQVEGNLGREALAYLTFLDDHYDDLPDYAVFNHGHNRAWHQPMRMVDLLSTLNFTALNYEHFINLRCHESPGCTDQTKYYFDHPREGDKRWGYHLEKFWNDRMRPQIGRMPRTIGTRCCAQFVVDKTAMLGRPHIFYKRLRQPLASKNISEILRVWGEELPEARLGTMFEMTWHIIFGKPADHCPSGDYCNKVFFQDLISCDREINIYAESAGWENIVCTNKLFQ